MLRKALLVFVFLLFALPALAQEVTPTPTPDPVEVASKAIQDAVSANQPMVLAALAVVAIAIVVFGVALRSLTFTLIDRMTTFQKELLALNLPKVEEKVDGALAAVEKVTDATPTPIDGVLVDFVQSEVKKGFDAIMDYLKARP